MTTGIDLDVAPVTVTNTRGETIVIPEVPVAQKTESSAPDAPPVADTLKTHEWQPVDEHGRPLGGKQVIKYKDQEDLLAQIQTNYQQAIRRLRQVTRDARLGLVKEDIPNDADRFENPPTFQPRDLTAEERFEISQQINDPEKVGAARDRLLESAIGVPLPQLRKILSDADIRERQQLAYDNYIQFVQSESAGAVGYRHDEDNAKTLTDWMFKNRLAPTVKNFVYAAKTLKESGLILEAPVRHQETPVVPAPATPVAAPAQPVDGAPAQPQATSDGRITVTEARPVRPTRVPSGLNDRVSSATDQKQVGEVTKALHEITLADIDKMPADLYRKQIQSNPAFAKLVNKLEAEATQRRPAPTPR